MAELNGKDFRARVELTNKANQSVAHVGETCERVDPKSLGWLFEQKLIEPTEQAWQDLSQSATEKDAPAPGDLPGDPAASAGATQDDSIAPEGEEC